MEILEIIANNLKNLRKHHRYSQDDLSLITNINKGNLSKYENMRSEIKTSTLFHISKCYRINPRLMYIDSNDDFDVWFKIAKDTYDKVENINDLIKYINDNH